MTKRNFTRRDFIERTTAGVAGAVAATGMSSLVISSGMRNAYGANEGRYSTEAFAREVEQLSPEEPYDYHKRLSASPVHIARRDKGAQPKETEMSLPDKGWKLVFNPGSSVIIRNAVLDFQDYLEKSQDVKVQTEERHSLDDWNDLKQCIVVGTVAQLPGCGLTLKGKKDYEITSTSGQIIVCGFDDHGAMFGLYNLEARMNLREAPFLPVDLNTVRHSLYDTRMVHSWMGWMEWPDSVLSHLAHDGFDAIFASPQTNPNGDRSTAGPPPSPFQTGSHCPTGDFSARHAQRIAAESVGSRQPHEFG